MAEDRAIVEVRNLRRLFPVTRGLFSRPIGQVHAVDDVSFTLHRGETLGLVGESGCGKTTTGRLLVKLDNPTSGSILFRGPDGVTLDLATLKGKEVKRFRRHAQMVFQDPYESINPRRTIYDTIAEPLTVQKIGNILERREMVEEILAMVGLMPPRAYMFRYPHELSGGQRQRVAIARALVLKPAFVVADEPTSMLDVSVRAGILQLLLDLGQQFNTSYLYITHDLALARYMCDRIAVMYLGKIVEVAPAEELITNPLHPYTRALLAAVPVPDPRAERPPVQIKEGVVSAFNPAPTCRFLPRCPISAQVCEESEHPPLEDKGGGHFVACYRV